MNADEMRGGSQPVRRLLREKSMHVARVGAIVCAVLLLGGCALAMLKGASNSGGGSASAGSSGSATRTPSRTAAQQSADDAISASVRSRFKANSALKPLNLIVDTHDGVVTLRGQVANVGQRNAAQAEARAVKGVKSVQNFIAVR
jgi:BON domain-containing protein